MTIATDMRDLYIAAEKAVLEGRTATINGITLSMEDLGSIRAGRHEWEARVAAETVGISSAPSIGGRTYSVARLDL